MREEIIWILSGVALFLLGYLMFCLYERKRLMKEVRGLHKSEEDMGGQVETLTREKEFLESQLEEAKKNVEKNRKLALYDYITGLPNHLALTEILEGAVKTLRKDETLVLICIDPEYFEGLDKQMSYAYKDELLVDITDRLRQAVNESDLLACVDGNRFVVLAQNLASVEEIEEMVKRVKKVFSYPFVLAATEIFMSIYIGVCLGPKDGKTAQTLLKNLNTALLAAKRKGKDQYCYYEESLSKEMMSRIELQSQLRAGIENKEFELYYQPQVDLRTEKVRGFEALIRWMHPARGVLLRENFLSIAEETGLVVPIGRWVLEEACMQLSRWQEQGYQDLVISINLSLRQLREKNLVSEVRKIVEKTGVDQSRLLFEIPEQALMEEPAMTAEQVQRLEGLGVQISLDNFGKGLCYPKELESLSAHTFKIDPSFVKNEDGRSLPALMALAKAYGGGLAAEGVEKEGQKKLLSNAGCEWVQGVLYSEPVTAAEAEQLLKW